MFLNRIFFPVNLCQRKALKKHYMAITVVECLVDLLYYVNRKLRLSDQRKTQRNLCSECCQACFLLYGVKRIYAASALTH